mgnify:CR=1 FL=1
MKHREKFGSNSKTIFDYLKNKYPDLIKEGIKYNPRFHSGYIHHFLKNGTSLWFVIHSDIAKSKQDKDGKWLNTIKDGTRIVEEYIKNADSDYLKDVESEYRLIFARDNQNANNNYVFMGLYKKEVPSEEEMKKRGYKFLIYNLISGDVDLRNIDALTKK